MTLPRKLGSTALAAALAGLLGAAPAPSTKPIPGLAEELSPPIRITAGDQFIDVDTGHAAPFFGDIDGDGVKDLLVGQFSGGKMRIYHNSGTNAAPKFDKFTWFQAGGEDGKVPYG
jgi:hypothetical protein